MTIKSNVMQQMVNGSLAQANKPAKVMDVELVLTDKQLALIGESVDGSIRADDLLFQGDELKGIVAKAMAKVLKPDAKVEPTYAWWNFVATNWQNVYMARNKLSNENSANNAWYDVCKRMKKDFALEKPKAPSADASRMSEKRKAEQAELQAKPDSVLREEILAYKAEDTAQAMAKATKLTAEIERRKKLADADSIEQRKAKQALLAKAMKKIADDDLLNQLWALVPQSIKLDIAKE
jgi:hypothetical protein